MNIRNLLEQGSATMLLVTPMELREFAISVVEEVSRVQEEPKFTAAEFAERHGVDKSTIYRWRKAGLLKPFRVGTKIYYRDSDLSTN
ncbi:MAG: helix-turn-helix domain-containing protein [Prevotella sp.]|nr:helix-turn-helix domain-containing protein [Prevotella sp.]